MAPGRRNLGRSFARAVLIAIVATAPAFVDAQTFEAPPSSYLRGIRPRLIATGRDGSILIVGERGPFYSQRFPNASVVPDAPIALNVDAFQGSALTAIAHDGYALAWHDEIGDPAFGINTVFTQRLSSKGALQGFALPVSPGSIAQARPHGIGPRGDGFVVGWEQENLMLLRPFDATGTPSGPLFDPTP